MCQNHIPFFDVGTGIRKQPRLDEAIPTARAAGAGITGCCSFHLPKLTGTVFKGGRIRDDAVGDVRELQAPER